MCLCMYVFLLLFLFYSNFYLISTYILSSIIIICSVLTVWICAISWPWRMRDPLWGIYHSLPYVIAYRIITSHMTCYFPKFFYFLYSVSFLIIFSSFILSHHLISSHLPSFLSSVSQSRLSPSVWVVSFLWWNHKD